MGLQLCEAAASETRSLVPLRILASSSAVHMSPRLLSTAIAPSAAAAPILIDSEIAPISISLSMSLAGAFACAWRAHAHTHGIGELGEGGAAARAAPG